MYLGKDTCTQPKDKLSNLYKNRLSVSDCMNKLQSACFSVKPAHQ